MAGSGPGPWSSCRPPSSPPRSMGCGAPALGDWALRPPCQTPCPDWQEHTASGAALISRWPLVAVSSAAGPWRLWAGRARGPSGSRCAHRPDSWLARGLRGPAWAVPWDKGRLPQVLRGVCLTDGAFARCSRPLTPQGPREQAVAPELAPPARVPGLCGPGEGRPPTAVLPEETAAADLPGPVSGAGGRLPPGPGLRLVNSLGSAPPAPELCLTSELFPGVLGRGPCPAPSTAWQRPWPPRVASRPVRRARRSPREACRAGLWPGSRRCRRWLVGWFAHLFAH